MFAPTRVLLLLKLACVLAAAAGASAQPPAAPGDRVPMWIWAREPAGGDDVCRFVRVIELTEPARKAELRMTCDNEFTAYVAGARVLRGSAWERSYYAEVARHLLPGTTLLAVEARNKGGPAGLIGDLRIELASGAFLRIVTDGQWEVCRGSGDAWRRVRDPASCEAARELGPLGMQPWGDPFVPRVATDAKALRTKPGYTVTRERSADEWQGSWVSMTFDARGRLYVGVERGGILRLAQPGGSGDFVALGLPPAVTNVQGMTWAHGALWANVNLNDAGGGLFRLRDAEDDGVFEDVVRVQAWKGDGEHGAHAVVPGPDGSLWVINGNMTDLPASLARTSPHRLFAEDVLLPPIEDPNGHAVGVKAPGSHVLRVSADGRNVELFAAGLRNAYDIAFDAHGELYTFDSDMEWDLGLPWYRPVRVCRMVSGAEFGWRSGTGCWPVHFFDSLPPVLDIGRGSPTGVTFWYGKAVAAADHGAFVAADWSLGRILLVRVDTTPATSTTLVAGKPLNVSDVAVGPDGALWFVTGGRSTQSGLYRIAWSQEQAEIPPIAPLSDVARRRRGLEALHGRASAGALLQAWPFLAADDRELRHAARVAIERQEVAAWRGRALAEKDPAAARAALLALARAGERGDLDAIVVRLLDLGLTSGPRTHQLEALRVLGVAFARHGAPDHECRARLLAALDGPLPSDDTVLARERAAVQVFLGARDVVVPLLGALEVATTQADQIAFAFLLSHVADGWSEDTLARFGRWSSAAREQLGGGNSFRGYLDAIRDTLAERLVDPALRAQAAAWAAAERPRPTATAAVPQPFVRAWTAADLLPHVDQIGQGRSFAAGQRAAQSAQCITCHRFAGSGGSIGPDLTSVSSRLGRRDLIEAILEPSKVISEQYRLVVVALQDGSAHAGRIVRETADTIVLAIDPVAGTTATVRKAEVVARTPSPVSSMPAGLLNTLTLEQILDLLAYFENDGDKTADAFQ